MLALYIGGMGARDKNFYNDYATQLGYGDAARKRSRTCTSPARRPRRWPQVPDQLVDDVALVGPRDRIRDRMQRWIEAGKKNHVGSMLIGTRQPEALQLMAELSFNRTAQRTESAQRSAPTCGLPHRARGLPL